MVRRLSERERIEILIMIGYGDKARTQLEVCRLFNNKYPNREPITQSTVSKIEQKFLEVGHAIDRPRTGRPPVQEDVKLNLLLELQENPHLPTRQVAANNGIVQSSVLKYLKLYKWHPYKVVLVQELNEDEPDHRVGTGTFDVETKNWTFSTKYRTTIFFSTCFSPTKMASSGKD
ncbi:hypothetical protein NQ318_009342 [Aromia moschata]|uniref:DUF4817 domain-containing protein n=1 Tax=Aromia moschata TaxID=1265417 RepID=A0AAV8XPX8_9CUCU|nr:hypothetical protein NQ318_009342 [Aromia moschata]